MTLGFPGALLGIMTLFAVAAAYLPELYEPRMRARVRGSATTCAAARAGR